MKTQYRVIGLMSGTSLDGLDIAGCEFRADNQRWNYDLVCAETIDYSDELKTKLARAHASSAHDLAKLHVDLGIFHGELTKKFMEKNNFVPDFISSHGHTVFHQPEIKLTLQIGSPAHIASTCQTTVVADFRSADVALGGHGAPLVPVGDKLLFADYKYCLNLGGVGNISEKLKGAITAFDICLCNMPMNELAMQLGKAYDDSGEIAAKGLVNEELLKQLNSLSYFELPAPKSLGREFYEQIFFPILNQFDVSIQDRMATIVEHIAIQISKVLDNSAASKMLVTGGGAYNAHLISRLKSRTQTNIVIPSAQIISFKEALIFAFLGVLKIRNEPNCLSSVTGAPFDHVGGAIY
jgi:anhydro-N-acetylmuramic acid kinase